MKKDSKRHPKFQLGLFLLFAIPGMLSCMILESTSKDVSIKFPNDTRVDQSFLSGQPCKSPCWYGLILGESSVEEIRAAFPVLSFIEASSMNIQEFSADPDELLFFASCVYSNPDEDCVWIETSQDGILRKITLKIYYPLTLGSAIDRLGSPAYYISIPISGRDACRMHIYWPDASVIALLAVAPKEKYCVSEEIQKVNLESQIDTLIYTVIENQQDGIPWTEQQ